MRATVAEINEQAAREIKLASEWSRVAKEIVKVEEIGGSYYAFGSELAALRLFYHFRHSFAAGNTKAAYSENQKTWFFRLEV